MADLEIRNLIKRFDTGDDAVTAVNDVCIPIEDGEFLVMVGPSGCGKSTTLRCVAGLEQPTEGDILLGGESVVNRKPMDRNMAMVFQNYALYPHMTARENISFGLKMTTDLSQDEIDSTVEETATMMGIEEHLGKKPDELSGGQQQRVALGRAIVRDPEVFLMDEPLSNLDAKLRTTMRTELQNLQNELEVTTIYVTHDQTEAMTMADKIAILNQGELQQLGTPLECYQQPVNKFVAGFIGDPSMNFLDVRFTGSTLEHEGFTYELSEDILETVSTESERMTLGVRPESIEVVSDNHPNGFPVTVDVTEPMGNETHLYIDVGDDTVTATVDGHTRVSAGNRLHVAFSERSIHLFDAENGEAVRKRDSAEEELGPLETEHPYSQQ